MLLKLQKKTLITKKNVNKTNQQSVRTQASYDFNPQECKVIALNYAENHLSKNII